MTTKNLAETVLNGKYDPNKFERKFEKVDDIIVTEDFIELRYRNRKAGQIAGHSFSVDMYKIVKVEK